MTFVCCGSSAFVRSHMPAVRRSYLPCVPHHCSAVFSGSRLQAPCRERVSHSSPFLQERPRRCRLELLATALSAYLLVSLFSPRACLSLLRLRTLRVNAHRDRSLVFVAAGRVSAESQAAPTTSGSTLYRKDLLPCSASWWASPSECAPVWSLAVTSAESPERFS